MSMPPYPPQDPYGQQPGGYGQPGQPGQPGPYGPPGQYGQPGPYGYGGGMMEHPSGTTILVLGILSLVICGLLGPFAWSMGNKALTEIDHNPGAYTNRGSVAAGRICGMIATILMIVVVTFYVIFFIALASSS